MALGSSSTTFGQDGTYSFPNNNHHAFWEAFHADNEPPVSGTLFTASAGDQIRANINYGSGTYSGTVTDVSNGVVNGWSSGSGFNISPTQGEAVVEQPQDYDMADFGSVAFSYAQGDGAPLNAFPDFEYTNSPNETTGGINSNGGFTITWNHC